MQGVSYTLNKLARRF